MANGQALIPRGQRIVFLRRCRCQRIADNRYANTTGSVRRPFHAVVLFRYCVTQKSTTAITSSTKNLLTRCVVSVRMRCHSCFPLEQSQFPEVALSNREHIAPIGLTRKTEQAGVVSVEMAPSTTVPVKG
ncbi:hypothetical protein LSAT2_009392 [Lamellibrachia satsuma]|nr:hypothetical protein LSAT2_009392 [Lamellibrachia satsuma]